MCIVTQESVASLQLLGLDGAVSADDLLEDRVRYQLAFNGSVILILGQPPLAREHVLLRTLHHRSARLWRMESAV